VAICGPTGVPGAGVKAGSVVAHRHPQDALLGGDVRRPAKSARNAAADRRCCPPEAGSSGLRVCWRSPRKLTNFPALRDSHWRWLLSN